MPFRTYIGHKIGWQYGISSALKYDFHLLRSQDSLRAATHDNSGFVTSWANCYKNTSSHLTSSFNFKCQHHIINSNPTSNDNATIKTISASTSLNWKQAELCKKFCNTVPLHSIEFSYFINLDLLFAASSDNKSKICNSKIFHWKQSLAKVLLLN